MFHQNLRHTGYSNSKAPDTNNTLWSYTTGNYVYSGPVVADGRVFIGSVDHNVYALNEATGTKIWNYDTGGVIGYSNPAVADGMVFISSGSGCSIYALNEVTGTKIWNYTTDSLVWSSPTVTDGKVFIGSLDGNLYALNEFTGTKIWNYTTGDEPTCSPTVVDGMVFTGLGGRSVYALNEATGDMIWNYTTGDWVDVSTPAVVDGMVFIGSSDHSVYALNEFTGTKIWSYTTGGEVYSSPAVADGKVFVGSTDHSVYALNEVTGTKIWNYTTADVVFSSPAVADGKVFVGSKDHNVYALNEATGTKIWSYNTGGTISGSPAVADGMLFVGSYDYKVYAFGSQGDLWIEDIQPVQTLVDCSTLVPGKPTVFNMTIVSMCPYPKSNVYMLITCGSQSWYEGPLTIPGNKKIPFCTGGTYYSNGLSWAGQYYRPLGEFDVTIKIDAFSPGAHTFSKHIGPTTGYQFKDLGQLKVVYVPTGFWGGLYAWIYGEPGISKDEMARERASSDSFIKAVFPVNPSSYTSEIGADRDLRTPASLQPGIRQYFATYEFWESEIALKKYHQPDMGGYDRVVAVVPYRGEGAESWLDYWLGKPAGAIGMTEPFPFDTVSWCEKGYWATPAHELWHTYTHISDEHWHCPNYGGGYWDQQHASEMINCQPPLELCLMHGGDQYEQTLGDGRSMSLYQWICPECYANLTKMGHYSNDPDVLFVGGIVFDNDTVNLQPFYHFSDGYADLESGDTGNYTLRFLDVNQQVLGNVGFNMTFDSDLNFTGFGFAVPYPSNASQIQLLHGDTVIASRGISANPPLVNMTYPSSGETLTSGQDVTIQWQASDPENDILSYTVLYTPDNGSSWIPIQTDVTDTSLNWTVPNDHPADQCRVKVVATDGVNTGEAISSGTFTILRHGVSTDDIQMSKSIIGNGYSMATNVTVSDSGNYTETPKIDIYANTTLINSQTITLSNGSSTTIILAWNTTGFALGSYTVSAYVWPVPGEIDMTDNNFTGGTVKVTIAGDINGDFTVDIYDAITLAGAYNSIPKSSSWNPNADINNDNIVDIYDAIILAGNYGKTA
jgi:outer membrane protein assembly factor BamB